MNFRKTLVLAVLLLLAVAYIFKVQLPQDEAKQAEGRIFASVDKDVLHSIEISTSQGVTTLKNTKPQPKKSPEAGAVGFDLEELRAWELAELPGSDVDRPTLNALISALSALKLETPLAAGDIDSDLSVYGLQKPELSLKVTTDKKVIELLFGQENNYVSKRYVKLPDSKEIYLVAADLFSSANKSRDDFRNKAPLEFIDGDVKSITLHPAAQAAMKFEIDDSYRWHIIEPAKYSASNEALSTLTREIRSIRSASFVDGDYKQAAYGLDAPVLRVELNFKNPEKQPAIQLTFGAVKEGSEKGDYLAVEGKPSLFKLTEDFVPKLVKPLSAFRETNLFRFASDQAVQLDFDLFETAPVNLVRSGSEWLVNNKPADEKFVKQLLEALSEFRAEGFPEGKGDFGFEKPRLKLVLRLGSSEPGKKVTERTLVVGKSADESSKEATRFYAAVDDMKEPFIINANTLKSIFPRREVLAKPAEQPTPVVIATPQS